MQHVTAVNTSCTDHKPFLQVLEALHAAMEERTGALLVCLDVDTCYKLQVLRIGSFFVRA
jgi:hypothetical protein